MTDFAVRPLAAALLAFIALARPSLADVALVSIDGPKDQVWVGQKATFYVNLRGKGPFVGASSFTLPQIPRTIILKVGNPVVSSKEIEGASWFVQSHEFAVFSQTDGVVEITDCEARFSNRDGFTGPAQRHDERVPAIRIEIQRPPGSDAANFLVTTDTLTVEEQWQPTPGDAKQGDVFHRTITQRAEQVSGMALAPPSTTVPDGVRVHFEEPEVEDKMERGEFTGSRTDRITYVMERPGTQTLPAVKYVWWQPKSEQFGTTTLSAAVFEVAAVRTDVSPAAPAATPRRWLPWMVASVGVATLAYLQRQRIGRFFSALGKWLDRPQRRIARKLLRACQLNDAVAAESAWMQWRAVQASSVAVDPDVLAAVTGLQRQLYGPGGRRQWDGRPLAAAFQRMQSATHKRPTSRDLPPLNPTGE